MSEPADPKMVNIELECPIERESGAITSLSVRKPGAGELRGLKIQDIMGADVNTMIVLIPRISSPFLTAPEVESLDPADFAEISGTIVNFFYGRTTRESIAKITGG